MLATPRIRALGMAVVVAGSLLAALPATVLAEAPASAPQVVDQSYLCVDAGALGGVVCVYDVIARAT